MHVSIETVYFLFEKQTKKGLLKVIGIQFFFFFSGKEGDGRRLAILVISAPGHTEQREAIRDIIQSYPNTPPQQITTYLDLVDLKGH